MKLSKLIALSTAALLSTAAFAEKPVELNDANKQAITDMLTEMGYEVGKIKLEDGMYEAYAKNDEGKYEIFLNGDFEIVKTVED